MGTPSSRPRSGCCGLSSALQLALCKKAKQQQQQGTAEREREGGGGGERR